MGSHTIRAKNIFFLFITGLGRYRRQCTDTAGNGTEVSKGGGAELVHLRAAAG